MGAPAKIMHDDETSDDDVTLAHAHCKSNRSELLGSDICGCFYCLEIFSPSEIIDWTIERCVPLFRDNVLVRVNDKQEQSALCPKSGIDSVIGSHSGCPITVEFLSRMQERWFKASN
jgi:hypothetical protein